MSSTASSFATPAQAATTSCSPAARWLWVADGVPELRRTGYDAASAGARIVAADWPDPRSVRAALVEPVDAIVATRMFEGRAVAMTV